MSLSKSHRRKLDNLDEFTQAYLECALWSSTTDEDVPMDNEYGISDIAEETLDCMIQDCEEFQKENEQYLSEDSLETHTCSYNERAGHDFWLTRNGHSAGFWDGDWEEDLVVSLDSFSPGFANPLLSSRPWDAGSGFRRPALQSNPGRAYGEGFQGEKPLDNV